MSIAHARAVSPETNPRFDEIIWRWSATADDLDEFAQAIDTGSLKDAPSRLTSHAEAARQLAVPSMVWFPAQRRRRTTSSAERLRRSR